MISCWEWWGKIFCNFLSFSFRIYLFWRFRPIADCSKEKGLNTTECYADSCDPQYLVHVYSSTLSLLKPRTFVAHPSSKPEVSRDQKFEIKEESTVMPTANGDGLRQCLRPIRVITVTQSMYPPCLLHPFECTIPRDLCRPSPPYYKLRKQKECHLYVSRLIYVSRPPLRPSTLAVSPPETDHEYSCLPLGARKLNCMFPGAYPRLCLS